MIGARAVYSKSDRGWVDDTSPAWRGEVGETGDAGGVGDAHAQWRRRLSTSRMRREASRTMPFLSGCFTSARQVPNNSSNWFIVSFSNSRRLFSFTHLFLELLKYKLILKTYYLLKSKISNKTHDIGVITQSLNTLLVQEIWPDNPRYAGQTDWRGVWY